MLSDSSNGLSIFEAIAPGEFPSNPTYYDPAYWPSHAVNYADLDGDSQQEVVLAGPGYSLYFYECTGNNELVWRGWLPLPSEATYSAVGDFDSDGSEEVAVGDHEGSVFEQGAGDLPGLMWQAELAPGGTVLRLTASDLDLDGATELLVVAKENDVSYTMYAMRGSGDNDYSFSVVTDFNDPSHEGGMMSAHLCGHAWPEIVVLLRQFGVYFAELYRAQPGQTFGLIGIAVLPEEYASAEFITCTCADFANDGIDAIVWPCWQQEGAILQIDSTPDVQAPSSQVLYPAVGSWFPSGTGSVEVVGESVDDFAGIREVEASRDDGESWERISIYPERDLTVELPDEGVAEVLIRARDCSNKLEDPAIRWWGYTSANSPTPTPTPTLTPATSPTPDPTATATASPAPTPVIEGVDLGLPKSHFQPGDTFRLDALLGNPGAPETGVPLALVLEVYGDYWFWPSWSRFDPASGSGTDMGFVDLPAGETELAIIAPFTWPDTGDETLTGLYFYGALLTEDLAAIRGVMDKETWGYGP